jgi:signal transduction histidine kinase
MSTQSQSDVETLREQLAEVLRQDDIDYDLVIKLSTELAKQDPENVRFSTDAAIISRLGRELVSKQETAVSELIKNAYDADATRVDLIFDNTNDPGGVLEILDDGNGMTREELINGFMRISSIDKIENPISPKYRRSRAGKKGIGRFAAQRLGKQLEIVTQTEEAAQALRVRIDWSEFEGGRDLSTVASQIEEIPKKQDHGTTLVIEDLRETWTEASIRRIFRYTSDIVQPFPLSEKGDISDEDPGFNINVFRKRGDDLETVADEETEILEHSLAIVKGKVDSEGNGVWSLFSNRLDISEEEIEMGREGDGEPFRELRNVRFEAHYFIYKKELVPHGYLTLLRNLGDEKGGIRVYRNGFRVLPYGEPADDWLRLDELYRKRSILPPIGNKHFFGFVAIDDPYGDRFEETSSREGLIENEAFVELQSFLHRVLAAAVQKIAQIRGKKQKAGQTEWNGQSRTERVQAAADKLSAAAESESHEKKEQPSEDEHARDTELREANQEFQEAIEALVEEVDMLRILAGLGLSIGEFTHEIKNSIGSVAGDANWLVEVLDDGTEKCRRADRLKRNIDSFNAYSAYFDQAVARNVSREIEIQDLSRVVRKFTSTAEAGAEKYGIEMHKPEVLGYDLYTCPMHPSEWPTILFNFFTNAKKAIDEAEVQGKVLIRVGRVGNKIFLEFQDNGIGISSQNEDQIFNAFFTTMPPAGFDVPDDEVLRGSGLGLKIVDDIISSYQGVVFVSEADPGFETCIRVELPAATEEEIKDYEG